MSAGSGVTHSEFNGSADQEVHFLQIWIVPNERNLEPSYGEWRPTSEAPSNQLIAVASGDPARAPLRIHQDATLYLGNIAAGREVNYKPAAGRYLWLQMIAGELTVNDTPARSGDGVALSGEGSVTIHSNQPSRFLLFDLS